MAEKYCFGCGLTKKVEDFHKDKSKADGRYPYCKECRKKITQGLPVRRINEYVRNRTEKFCPKCQQTKPIDDFYRDRNRADGRDGVCKSCSNPPSAKQIEEAAHAAIGEKICSRCKRWLPFSSFYPTQKGKYGLMSWCKTCVKEYQKTPQGKEHKKRYRQKNKELYRKHQRAYRQRNRELLNQRVREYFKTEKGRTNHRLSQQRRRYQQKALAATLTAEEWDEILERYNYQCLACGSTENLEIDHIIPLSKGGPLTKENVQPLCKSCNSRKNNRVIDYRPDRGALWV